MFVSDEKMEIRTWKSYDAANIHYKKTRDGNYSIHLATEKLNVLLLDYIVTVSPNTPYIISVDCRTEDVVDHEGADSLLGANISTGHYKNSKGLLGTNDRQTLRALGCSDSMGRLTVTMGLGYWNHACTGKAWFENIRIVPAEEYVAEDRTWHFLGIIMANTGYRCGDGSLSVHKMSKEEICSAEQVMRRVTEDMTADSAGLLHADMDVVVSHGLYDAYHHTDAFGYSMSHQSAYAYCIENGIDITGYDHVAFVMCQPNMPHTYFGLGGCFMTGYVGHTSVLYHAPEPLIESADPKMLWTPGIYVHEFLHAAENYADCFGYEHTSLHNGKDYGYTDADGWRRYYSDLMQNKVSFEGRYIGIHPVVWRIPPHVFD